MNFKELSVFIDLLKSRIPEDANVLIDFTDKKWINENLKQEVCNFNYDKVLNEFRIVFKESKDNTKELLFSRSFNTATIKNRR